MEIFRENSTLNSWDVDLDLKLYPSIFNAYEQDHSNKTKKIVNCILYATKFWNLLTLLKKCLRQHGPTESCQDELTSRQCSPRYVPWLWNREGNFKKKGQTELEIRESEFDNMHMAFIEKKGSFRSWVNSLNLWKWKFDGSPAWILWTQPQIPHSRNKWALLAAPNRGDATNHRCQPMHGSPQLRREVKLTKVRIVKSYNVWLSHFVSKRLPMADGIKCFEALHVSFHIPKLSCPNMLWIFVL